MGVLEKGKGRGEEREEEILWCAGKKKQTALLFLLFSSLLPLFDLEKTKEEQETATK